MPFCQKCGTKLSDEARFCPSCGEAVVASAASTAQQTPPTQQTVPPVQPHATTDRVVDAVKKFIDTPDSTASLEATDIAQNKGMAILSYFGLLLLIPLFAAKNSRFARYHVNQGLTLLLVEIACGAVNGIFGFIKGLVQTTKYVYGIYPVQSTPWFVSVPLGIISAALGIATLALAVIGIVNAAQGKARELPLIGRIQLLK